MLPRTTSISPNVGTVDSSATAICFHDSGSSPSALAGTICGLKTPSARTYSMYIKPSSTPGTSAPMNRSPTDVDTWSAISTSMIDGGIRMPSVPEAATTPDATDFE
jgi:hypothetical protein